MKSNQNRIAINNINSDHIISSPLHFARQSCCFLHQKEMDVQISLEKENTFKKSLNNNYVLELKVCKTMVSTYSSVTLTSPVAMSLMAKRQTGLFIPGHDVFIS
jgi:hypothetical protein